MRWLARVGLVWALFAGLSARAGEPGAARWTPLLDSTVPAEIANYATLTEEAARQLLETQDATLLWDRQSGFSQVPEGGFVMASRRRLMTEEGFAVAPAPEGGWGLWRTWSSRQRDRARLDGPDHPMQRLLALPSDVTGVAWRRLSPFNPIVAVFDDQVFVAHYLSIRMRDPFDPTGSTYAAYLVAGTTFPLSAVLDGPRDGWRVVLTVAGMAQREPRVAILPVDAVGQLDTARDGVLLRFGVPLRGVGEWSRTLDNAVVPSAVRLHFGDRESLKAKLDSLPAPPRERFAQPGGPTDPLMLRPRSPRDPMGYGVEARVLGQGDLTLVDLTGVSRTDNAIQPAWDGVDVGGWFGRVHAGVAVRPATIGGQPQNGLVAARVMGRVGRMRDTGYTAMGLELGTHLGPPVFGELTHLVINGVLQSQRLTGRTLFDQPVEMGNRFRIGTTGIEYEMSGGLRTYAGKGWVLVPTGMGGFRFDIRHRRVYLVIGAGVEVSLNRNAFRRSSASREIGQAQPTQDGGQGARPTP